MNAIASVIAAPAPPPPSPPAAVVAPPPPPPPPLPAPVVVAAPPPPPPAAPAPDPTLRVPFSSAPPAPSSRGGVPGWAIGIGFAVALAGILYVLFTYVLPKKSDAAASATPAAESAPAVAGAKKPHPLAKFLEIVGIRWVEDAKQKAKMQFIVVNHSAADLPELKMQITVKAGGKTLFEIPFTVSSIGPYESKEFSTPIQTALKEYELPDWQFVKAEFAITSEP